MTAPALPLGTRVRIVAGLSIASKLHEGRTGFVVERSPNLVATETPEYRAAFPISVAFLYQTHGFVWAADEVEVIDEVDPTVCPRCGGTTGVLDQNGNVVEIGHVSNLGCQS